MGMAALLNVLFVGQSTLKLYKILIDLEWVFPRVCIELLTKMTKVGLYFTHEKQRNLAHDSVVFFINIHS